MRRAYRFLVEFAGLPGLNTSGAGESKLAAVHGPESCGTSRDGQSKLIDRVP
jgi:hypothetical protein